MPSWLGHAAEQFVAGPDPELRPGSAHVEPVGPVPQPWWQGETRPSASADPYGPHREAEPPQAGLPDPAVRPWSATPAASGPEGGAGGSAGAPWSLREVLDLAAAAELGARQPAPSGPAQSPIGPVTPGQAARLQSVHLEQATMPHPQPTAVDTAGNPFNPPSMVAMPPLADHAPRPPAPEEIRPPDGEHAGAGGHLDGNGEAGEVARVR
ncbi:hypothetical protein [Streptacidiphilus melanogenes]|uniref:hypothetical protein n=1 Tax=Streptacidiphilus melanogenes TaxID=411235 RepID=UPI0005A731C3|nr:hypothetical protein [Streptacidiphilus melanogenes]